MKWSGALAAAALLVYGAAYLIDYACDGCLQEQSPVGCREYRGNPISWWQCAHESQRAPSNGSGEL